MLTIFMEIKSLLLTPTLTVLSTDLNICKEPRKTWWKHVYIIIIIMLSFKSLKVDFSHEHIDYISLNDHLMSGTKCFKDLTFYHSHLKVCNMIPKLTSISFAFTFV